MMSLETIQAENEKAGQIAAYEAKRPYFFFKQDLDKAKADVEAGYVPAGLSNLPYFGSFRPKGFELVGSHFTDAMGFNLKDAGGPALSVYQFVNEKLSTDSGFAIIEAGQFQVIIGEFKQVAEAGHA